MPGIPWQLIINNGSTSISGRLHGCHGGLMALKRLTGRIASGDYIVSSVRV